MSKTDKPFTGLGNHLKYVREQSKQTLSEVSGAVEIEEQQLARIEAGLERPAEDILLLLISHFGVQDREAVQLWELAEYDSDVPDEIGAVGQPHLASKPMVMLLAVDVRTMYSDGLDITVNPAGVTLNFTQMVNPSQTAPVARVGMSHQQAEQVIQAMQQALLRARYLSDTKLLPPNL
ncbi:MAG: helix-turn-helix transcriptional regulator [Patescibacteria group bacterium]